MRDDFVIDLSNVPPAEPGTTYDETPSVETPRRRQGDPEIERSLERLQALWRSRPNPQRLGGENRRGRGR